MNVSLHHFCKTLLLKESISEKTSQIIDEEIKDILDQCEAQTFKTIESNKDFIEGAVKKLIEIETLDEDSLTRLWNELGH